MKAPTLDDCDCKGRQQNRAPASWHGPAFGETFNVNGGRQAASNPESLNLGFYSIYLLAPCNFAGLVAS